LQLTVVEVSNEIVFAYHERKRKESAHLMMTLDELSALREITEILEPIAIFLDTLQADSVTSSLVIPGVISTYCSNAVINLSFPFRIVNVPILNIAGVHSVPLDEDLFYHNELKQFRAELLNSISMRFANSAPSQTRKFTTNVFANENYLISTILDPRFKLMPFERKP